MSVTNRVQCYSYDTFDLYTAIIGGKLTFSTDRHLVLLDYDVDNLGISSIVEAWLDPVNPGEHGTLHYNKNNGKVYFSDGDEFVHVGTVLPRNGINVISRELKVAPETVAEGDQYLVSSLPGDTWKPHKNHIAYYNGVGWEFTPPESNQIVGVENEFADYTYNGYTWVKNFSTDWVQAIGCELQDEGNVIPVLFSAENPGVVSSSSSGSPGVAISVSRSDHDHALGIHLHEGDANGGRIDHSSLLMVGANDHHTQVHSGLDHTGIIGTWSQINFAGSSLAQIQSKSHTLLTDKGINTHDQIDFYIINHDHDGNNSKEVKKVDGGLF